MHNLFSLQYMTQSACNFHRGRIAGAEMHSGQNVKVHKIHLKSYYRKKN